MPIQNVRKIIEKPEYAERLDLYPVGTPALVEFVMEMVLGEMGLIILGMVFLILITTAILYRSISICAISRIVQKIL